MARFPFITFCLLALLLTGAPSGLVRADDAEKKDSSAQKSDQEKKDKAGKTEAEKKKEKEEALTLENLFPKKSFFGPSASAPAFSYDGRYAAYLYRPYKERRHGADLWLYDTQTRQLKRLTSVSVMSEFQSNTRKVRDDRVKKAKPALEKKLKDRIAAEKKKSGKDGKTDAKNDAAKTETKTTSETATAKSGDGATSSTLAKDARTSESQTALLAKLLEEEDEETRLMKRGDWVDDTDATINDKDDEDKDKEKEDDQDQNKDQNKDNEKKEKGDKKEPAPRYSGIESFEWSETASELLFVSEGDVYRFAVGDEKPARLTRTAEPERSVQWLPDGSGFLYRQGNSLRRIFFNRSLVEELRAKLGDGDELAAAKLSPDGRWLALIANKSNPQPAGQDQKYSIAKYRDRRMEPERISRTVLDDPQPEREFAIFLLEIGETFKEESETTEVFRFKTKAPGATISQPDWAPDSTRIVFSCWDQEASQVSLYEALTRPEEKKPRKGEKKGEKGDAPEEKKGKNDQETRKDNDQKDEKDSGKETEKKEDQTDRSDQTDKSDNKDEKKSPGDKKDDGKPKPEKARKIYSFMHTGGPNTPEMIEPQYLGDSRRIVFLSEITGFRHLQILDPLYEGLSPLTHGYFEVYPIALSKDHKWVFIYSTQDHPGRQSLYKVSTDDGTLVRLSPELGYYEGAAVSPQGDYALANFSTFGKLRELVAVNTARTSQTTLTRSHPPIARLRTRAVPEFITYKNRQGHDIHGQIFLPDGWNKNDKWPLLVYVYGGPLGIRKMVTDGAYDQASYFFALYMAKKHGYVTVTIDPRGVSGYGGVFEKANYERVGRPQVEDLVDGVDYLVENYGVDRKRVGIHGWSFGGFQTQMCLYTEPDVFAAGAAGAGPTEWENYNAWYTRNTVGSSRTGEPDLKKFSLLPLAKNLKGQLLLIHGVEDTNVLYQDTMRVYRELLKAGKETNVELFVDPTGGHALGGDIKPFGRFHKYEQFFLRTLGEGKTVPPKNEEKKDGKKEDPKKDEKKEEPKKGDGTSDPAKKEEVKKDESGKENSSKTEGQNDNQKKEEEKK